MNTRAIIASQIMAVWMVRKDQNSIGSQRSSFLRETAEYAVDAADELIRVLDRDLKK